MRIAKVEIIDNPSAKFSWYKDLAGAVFEVYDDGRNYIIKKDYDKGHDTRWRHIDKCDCEEIEA